MSIYCDTSALAKRYVPESGTADFERFIRATEEPIVIGPLVATELASIAHRLVRTGHLQAWHVPALRERFAEDLAHSLWQMEPFDHAAFARASELIATLGVPLATLDALHIASALLYGCDSIATADRHLLRAASAAGLAVHNFVIDPSPHA